MKKLLTVLLIGFFSFQSFAQHCPFDGSNAIIILVKDKTGKILANPSVSISLSEIDNPIADSCAYAKGLLDIHFGTIEESLIKKYAGSWEMWAVDRIKECSFNSPGYFTVVLGQAEISCMIDNANEWQYIQRHYEIRIKDGDVVKQVVPTTDKDFYKLCTTAGSWTRIKPIEITITD